MKTSLPRRRRIAFAKVVLWFFCWPLILYWWLLVVGWRLLKGAVRLIFRGVRAGLRALVHWRPRVLAKSYGSGLAAIDRMDGYRFEARLSALFGALGYAVEPTKLSGDKGADLIVSRNGERIVIQAKCYGQGRRVGVAAVQQAVAAIRSYRAHRAAVVTNREFTRQAVEIAEDNGVRLWDRRCLEQAVAAEERIATDPYPLL